MHSLWALNTISFANCFGLQAYRTWWIVCWKFKIYPWFSVLLAACDFIVGKSGIQRLYSVWLQRGNWDDRNFEENKSFIRRFHYNLVSMTFLNVKEANECFQWLGQLLIASLFWNPFKPLLKSFSSNLWYTASTQTCQA